MASKQILKTTFILLFLAIGLYALYIFSFKGGAEALGISVDSTYKCRTASLLQKMWNTKTTKLPQLGCQNAQPMVTVSVSLFSYRECGGGPMWYDPICSSCNDPKTLLTLKSECDKCPNRIFKPEHYSSGKCILKQ